MNATVSIETVWPKQARQYLTNLVEGQRPVRDGHILRLATMIESDNWHLTSDALLFVKGKLANGQHRLHAVDLADKPCQFLVLRTDDEEVYKVLDAGIGRSAGDALHSMGVSASKEAAAVARLVVMFDRGAITPEGQNIEKMAKITRVDLIDYVEEHSKALEKEIYEVISLYAQKRILPVPLGAALLHLANRHGKGDAWTFIRNLYLGGSTDAAFDMRERLIRNQGSKYRLNRHHVFALLLKSYSSFVKGTRPGVLKMIDGEPFPKLP